MSLQTLRRLRIKEIAEVMEELKEKNKKIGNTEDLEIIITSIFHF